MEYFAQLDENNIVLQVIIVSPDDVKDSNDNVSEEIGNFFCKQLTNDQTHRWKRTCFEGTFRGRFGNIGYTYDESLDVFIAPQPFPSWTLDPITTEWICPIGDSPEVPQELIREYRYIWDEDLYQSDNTKGWVYIKI